MVIGIDLGTTNSLAAYLTEEGPRLIPNALGRVLTPSVVGVDEDGEVLVGDAAKELAVLHPGRCVSLFKRHMGSNWTATLGSRSFTPEELSSLVLRSLLRDAEAALGEPPSSAVVTVPAYFNDNQRKATIRAGTLAGIHVARIINEPTAASIAYGLNEAEEEKSIAVFDLGGGTFDVSVVEYFDGIVEVRASAGECFLGGEDFSRAMAARLLEGQGREFEYCEMEFPEMVGRLLQQCELAKIRLSASDAAEVRLPNEAGDCSPDDSTTVEITRTDFEAWISTILGRVAMPIRRALGDAGLRPKEIDEVILVGGATRTPAVAALVAELFGQQPQCRLDPEHVVALGAAIQAGLLAGEQAVGDMVVTDVAPFTLGIAVCKQFGSEMRPGYFLPIINRNTTIPTSRVERVITVKPMQTQVEVHVFQGESRHVDDCLLLGSLTVPGIPPGPPGQPVDIRFTYDANGVLEVEATVTETQQRRSLVIRRHASGLSDEDVAAAVENMQKLKIHPRELTANRYMLRRAERLYRELPQSGRVVLNDLLDTFEAALADGPPATVERARQALAELLSYLEEDDDGGGDAQLQF